MNRTGKTTRLGATGHWAKSSKSGKIAETNAKDPLPRASTAKPQDQQADTTVTLPRAEYERLLALAEDAEDLAAVAAFDRKLAVGEEELVSDAMVGRLLSGESPLRVWREHRGHTQSGLARASGVNRVVIADIEAGRKGGSVKSLKALAAALRVGIDDLVT